jgi:hypothetical protein
MEDYTMMILEIKWGKSEMSSPVSFLRLLNCFVKQLERQGWSLICNYAYSDWVLEKRYVEQTAAYQRNDVDKCYRVALGEWECGYNDDHMLCDEPIDFLPLKYELNLDH